MPYIKQDQRTAIDPLVDSLIQEATTDGEMNYVITRFLLGTWQVNPRYITLNRLIGILECVKLEFYRQYGAPYEDTKREENGPVKL